MDDNRIEPFIREAQIADLKPVLNDALYYDFLSKFDNDTLGAEYTKYQNLLFGCEWTYNGKPIRFDGVEPMLSYYVLASFIISNPINNTRFGVNTKIAPQSEPVDTRLLEQERAILKSRAITYQNQVIFFLQNNRTTYPLYNFNDSNNISNRNAFKVVRG